MIPSRSHSHEHNRREERIVETILKFGLSLMMNSLSFTLQHRKSTKTLRLHYGLEGMKYIIQIYEGEINGHGEKEGLPTEFKYEFEQEMLKHVHDLKKDLREKGWREGDYRQLRRHFIVL